MTIKRLKNNTIFLTFIIEIIILFFVTNNRNSFVYSEIEIITVLEATILFTYTYEIDLCSIIKNDYLLHQP